MIEFLVAVALLGSHVYNGQWDPWYARQCLAREYLLRWFQIQSAEDWMECGYIRETCHRRAKAIYWKLLRKHFQKQFNLNHGDHRLYVQMRKERSRVGI